jgi:plastocyanin
MIPSRSRRRQILPLMAFSLLIGPPAAYAATVKGTVRLPPELRNSRRFPGHWRVEGVLPIAPPTRSGDTVVLLTGIRGQAVPPTATTVEIAGLAANPATVVVTSGTVVEFRNSDKVDHELVLAEKPDIMPPGRLASGSIRKVTFHTPGEYLVRCTEYPHIVISVIVTNSPLFAIVDPRGTFHLPETPEGKGTLKVWSAGRFVHEQAIVVTAKGLDLNIKVAATTDKDSAE